MADLKVSEDDVFLCDLVKFLVLCFSASFWCSESLVLKMWPVHLCRFWNNFCTEFHTPSLQFAMGLACPLGGPTFCKECVWLHGC